MSVMRHEIAWHSHMLNWLAQIRTCWCNFIWFSFLNCCWWQHCSEVTIQHLANLPFQLLLMCRLAGLVYKRERGRWPQPASFSLVLLQPISSGKNGQSTRWTLTEYPPGVLIVKIVYGLWWHQWRTRPLVAGLPIFNPENGDIQTFLSRGFYCPFSSRTSCSFASFPWVQV